MPTPNCISKITWTVYGKIESITKTDGTTIVYNYDAAGNRITKAVTRGGTTTTTAYVRDAQGNVLSTYTTDAAINSGHLTQSELHLYACLPDGQGSTRLGIYHLNKDLSITPSAPINLGSGNSGGFGIFERNKKLFELTNHLGNVLATVSDKKIGVDADNNGQIDYYMADVILAQDYFPFGMMMPGRKYASGEYRYGFNGYEKDDEVKGTGNQLSYGDNGYAPRLGRRWNIDPFANKFPFQSPYTHANNSPIAGADVNGDSTIVVISGYGREVKAANGSINIMYDVDVYQNMTAAQYEVHKTNGTLPEPNYRTELARDAHDITSKGKTVVHSDQRYGTNNETPPGTYYLFKKGTNGDYNSGAYQLYIGDNNGSRVINGPDGVRAGIAIHQYDPSDSQGCLTTCSGRSTQPITDLMKAIPDLNDDTQPVQLILQEREVKQTTYSNSENGSVKYQGVEHIYYGGTLPEIIVTAKNKK